MTTTAVPLPLLRAFAPLFPLSLLPLCEHDARVRIVWFERLLPIVPFFPDRNADSGDDARASYGGPSRTVSAHRSAGCWGHPKPGPGRASGVVASDSDAAASCGAFGGNINPRARDDARDHSASRRFLSFRRRHTSSYHRYRATIGADRRTRNGEFCEASFLLEVFFLLGCCVLGVFVFASLNRPSYWYLDTSEQTRHMARCPNARSPIMCPPCSFPLCYAL